MYIRSSQEETYYQELGLVERNVNGYLALVRPIVFTEENIQKIRTGYSPIDYRSGEIIELHHIGQCPHSPFAELTSTEHRSHKVAFLHGNEEREPIDRNLFRRIRHAYWLARLEEYL